VRTRVRSLVFLVVLALALVACSQGTLLTTGTTLDALGKQFLETGTQLKAAKAQGTISEADYQKWAGFVPLFKKGFAEANKAWQTANAAGQKDAPQSILDLIAGLKNQLVEFLLLGVKP